MPGLSSFATLGPWHILSYGTLLGSQLHNTFLVGPISFMSIPRAQFGTLQSKLLPKFFLLSSVLPILLAITYPGVTSAIGLHGSGLSGIFEERCRWNVLAPFSVILISNLANLLYIGPKTTSVMKTRHHQETRDGKKSYDPPPHSAEMQRLNAQFGRLHGVSASVNLLSIMATVYYGFVLADRF